LAENERGSLEYAGCPYFGLLKKKEKSKKKGDLQWTRLFGVIYAT
jgi:hypothetical protein